MPVAFAIPSATGLPSAIMSVVSITRVKENSSPGTPLTASGLPPGAAADSGCFQL